MESNLSRIKPKLRTEGRVSGNFGRNKVRAGSQLNDIGNGEVGSLPSKQEYFDRLVMAYPRLPLRARPNILLQLRALGATLDCMDVVHSIEENYQNGITCHPASTCASISTY